MKKEYISFAGSKSEFGPRGIKAGNFLYTASAAMGDDGKAVSASFEEQAEWIMLDLKETLELAGSSLANILLLTIFVVDIQQNVTKLEAIFHKHFGGTDGFPMLATIGTDGLFPADPPLLIEMTCQALIPD